MENGQDKKLFAKKYRVASARLQGFDYASGGVYFITICTKDKRHFLGTIRDGEMQRSNMGHIVAAEWEQTAMIRKNVTLGAWIVMPNHFHAIVIIKNMPDNVVETHGNVGSNVETHCNASLRGDGKYRNAFGPQSGNVSAIIRGFKGASTKHIHAAGFSDFAWQSRFHDHIVRSEEDWRRIADYIVSNPKTWETDCNFSES